MVTLSPVAMTGGLLLDGTPRLDYGDMFASRIILTELPQTISISLDAATVEPSEPNLGAATSSAWVEVSAPVDTPERLKFTVTRAGTAVGTFRVYRQSDAGIQSDAVPTMTQMVSIVSATSTATVATSEQWGAYYVQILRTSGAGAFTITVEDADPEITGSYATAAIGYDDWGYEQVDTTNAPKESGEPSPAGIVPTGTAWVLWTCPDPAPSQMEFAVGWSGIVGTVALTAYIGDEVNALTQVATSVVLATDGSTKIVITPTAGVVYSIQVATTDDHNQYDVSWSNVGELVAPAEAFDHVRVVVYGADGTTELTELPRRRGVSFMEPLNTPGTGQVQVPLRDEVLKAYPALLNTGNYVKFWFGSTCVSGFRIQGKRTLYVSEGEYAGMVREVSGPTVHFLLDDFLVRHDGPMRPDSLDERLYSWASRPAEWYDPADWNDYTNVSSQQDPPGDWWRTAKKRRKYGQPKKWPDPQSKWLWFNGGAGYRWNDDDRKPERKIKGNRYYRREVKILSDSTRVRMFVTADEQVTVYVDGEEVIYQHGRETGYKEKTRRDIVLDRGMHTVALHTKRSRPVKQGKADGADGVMFTMFETERDGTRGEVLLRTNGTWKCFYGENPPAWKKAQVLRNCVLEARERDVDTANLLGLGFDGTTDSEGRIWRDRFAQAVRIGTSGLDLQSQLSEGNGFDVWIDPENLNVHAWKRRGKNKSRSVALIPGVSLLDWSIEEIDQISNSFLLKHDGGFTTTKAPGSIRKNGQREAYIELGGVKDGRSARKLMQRVIKGVDSAVRRAGSPDVSIRKDRQREGGVIGVEGAYPFLDFGVGDVISAPAADGALVPMRVLSISCTEDDEGNLSFDPELEQV